MMWGREREKSNKPLTEAEVIDLFHTLWCVGPMSPQWPFDASSCFEREFYFEKLVQPDLWGNLNFLLDMLSRREELNHFGNNEDFKHHISNYLVAICHLAPEPFYEKIKPSLENPDLRPILLTTLCMSDIPQAVEFLKPWVDRAIELNDDELKWLVDTFGQSFLDTAFDSSIRNEALFLLKRLRDEVPAERITVHEEMDFYFNK